MARCRAAAATLVALLGLAGCGGRAAGQAAATRPSAAAVITGARQPTAQPSAPGGAAWGGFPSFLPRDTVGGGALHTVVDASAEHPALASQGDPVRVRLVAGSVLATVTGPEVPNEGLAYQAPSTPATWTLTFRYATGRVPLGLDGFTAIDELGVVHRVRAVTGASVPAEVTPGATVSFRVTTTLRVGEGRFRWIPSGHLAPVEWDFVAETD